GGHSGMEKVITGISIVVALIIVVIVAVFALKGCGSDLPGFGETESQTSSAAESETESVSVPAGQTVEMKNLLGMTQRNAVKTLEEMGLVADVVTGPSDDYKEGQVFEQEYKEGEMLAAGTTVTIKVSTGAEAITIPTDILGASEATARSRLTNLGFNVAERTRTENSDTIDEGRVINTDPAAGSAAAKGATITLILSEGPATREVKVPDITGMTESRAVERLEDNELKAGSISYEESDDVEKGMVIRQNPEAGTTVDEDSSVSFVVSKGAENVAVPNLIGMDIDEAKSALRAAGLEMGTTREDYSEESDKDTIIGQSEREGAKVRKGTRIDVTIGIGPKPTTAAPTETEPTDPPETEPDDIEEPETFEDGGDPDEYENEPEPTPAEDELIP
ncbi:MAG: PASTA domain-containing protein, partial [Lachnospiraceae bacterium]|nr:PASTA domain-containing protein [Lachnospiraceae bacterium]